MGAADLWFYEGTQENVCGYCNVNCCVIVDMRDDLYLPVMEIDISKNLISQVLTIVVVILDDLILRERRNILPSTGWPWMDIPMKQMQRK